MLAAASTVLVAGVGAAEDAPDLDSLREAILETRERVGGFLL